LALVAQEQLLAPQAKVVKVLVLYSLLLLPLVAVALVANK
jgi:hypothetical protein